MTRVAIPANENLRNLIRTMDRAAETMRPRGEVESYRVWVRREPQIRLEGIRVRPVHTDFGCFVNQRIADACEKFLRAARKGGKC